jgi:multiple sugar transport system substrate-binding protein
MKSTSYAFRLVLLCAVAALLAAFAVGCDRHGDAVAGSAQHIKFWNGFTGPDGKTMEKMVRQFEAENPGILVDMQIIPWAQYYDKLTIGTAFKQGPDVYVCHANRFAEFAQYGIFRPLDDLISGPNGLPTNDFLPAAWQAAQYKGRPCAVPLDIHPMALYYNKKLFREAGIVDPKGVAKPPKNWEQFLQAAHKLTKDANADGQVDQWGFAFTFQHTNWYLFAFQHGGGPLTPDLSRAAMSSPEAIAATEQMRRIIDRERVAPVPEGVDAWLGFRQGRVAMAMEGIYMLADLQKTKGLEYGAAPVPQFGPVKASWAGSHLLCIPSTSSRAKTEAAWKLIRYLSEHSLEWAEGGQVPARLSLLRSEAFKKMDAQAAVAEQLSYVHYEPFSTRATEITPFIDSAVNSALLGYQTPGEALEEANARISRVLARP